jgi:hypothetical protein
MNSFKKRSLKTKTIISIQAIGMLTEKVLIFHG